MASRRRIRKGGQACPEAAYSRFEEAHRQYWYPIGVTLKVELWLIGGM